ncbi:glycoside hydrolase family 25 protein [Pseudomonas syringae group genomosp. 3]|uniref:Glycosyl hydrolase family protein n=1 Tax=Pseudomonas syringae pv. persicae TaxID=237306 RepID=A0AB38EMD9_9PSED|nr:glycoside hydrolase family 25 protein [Pseudomonas syringae group genomosp. 3]SOQ14661.1 glycosyl hydrolase family protein [Pseudomonas syringae pv. persicae]SOQ15804.1 glycosyl hydrolase family protein [Pseudomonas syringae pv. persicae]
MSTIKKGIDLSHFQGDIDFKKVFEAGIEYAIIKTTEGATVQDKKYTTYRTDARAVGIKTGAYHYFRALSSSPEAQLDNIVSTLTAAGFDASTEFFAIDAELEGNEKATPDEMADNLHKLLTLLDNEKILKSKKPFIYCDNNFWMNPILGEKYAFSEYPLWIANWDVSEPKVPASWEVAGKSWSIWQHSNKGRIAGIEVDVDLNWVRT